MRDLIDNCHRTLSKEKSAKRAKQPSGPPRSIWLRSVVQNLLSALHAIDCDCWLNTRVIADLPCVPLTLEALLAQATQLNVKTQRRLDYLEDDQPSQALKAVDKYAPADSLALAPTMKQAVLLAGKDKGHFA